MAITKGTVLEVTDKGDINSGYDSTGAEHNPNTHDWPDYSSHKPAEFDGNTSVIGWQKCPVCEGSGKSKEWAINEPNDCPTCEGKRIIDKLTGKPPK